MCGAALVYGHRFNCTKYDDQLIFKKH